MSRILHESLWWSAAGRCLCWQQFKKTLDSLLRPGESVESEEESCSPGLGDVGRWDDAGDHRSQRRSHFGASRRTQRTILGGDTLRLDRPLGATAAKRQGQKGHCQGQEQKDELGQGRGLVPPAGS